MRRGFPQRHAGIASVPRPGRNGVIGVERLPRDVRQRRFRRLPADVSHRPAGFDGLKLFRVTDNDQLPAPLLDRLDEWRHLLRRHPLRRQNGATVRNARFPLENKRRIHNHASAAVIANNEPTRRHE